MNSYVVLLTLEAAGMLTDLLQEKKEELERWASVCVCEAAQQHVTTADTRKQPPPSALLIDGFRITKGFKFQTPPAKFSPSPKQHPENCKGKLQVKSTHTHAQKQAHMYACVCVRERKKERGRARENE
jgi:hypothetical protein